MSDIDTAVVDSLKVLDPKRPIREADIRTGVDLLERIYSLEGEWRENRSGIGSPGAEILLRLAGVSPNSDAIRIMI